MGYEFLCCKLAWCVTACNHGMMYVYAHVDQQTLRNFTGIKSMTGKITRKQVGAD